MTTTETQEAIERLVRYGESTGNTSPLLAFQAITGLGDRGGDDLPGDWHDGFGYLEVDILASALRAYADRPLEASAAFEAIGDE